MQTDSDAIQVSFTLRGDNAARFRTYKSREQFQKDAEAARKLVLDQLSQVEAAGVLDARRKPMIRAKSKAEMRDLLIELLSEGTNG
jgi:hypothetical protein